MIKMQSFFKIYFQDMCQWLPFHIDCTDLQVWYCLSIPFVIENVFCFVIIHEKFFTSKPKLFKISNLFIYRIIECTHYSWSFIYWIMKKLVIHQKVPSVLVWAVSWIVKEISLAVITKLQFFYPKVVFWPSANHLESVNSLDKSNQGYIAAKRVILKSLKLIPGDRYISLLATALIASTFPTSSCRSTPVVLCVCTLSNVSSPPQETSCLY